MYDMHMQIVSWYILCKYVCYQEHVMTSFLLQRLEGGGRACNFQKFETDRISHMY